MSCCSSSFSTSLQLQQQGILKSDDLITRFFRISVEMCVDLCYRTLNDQVHTHVVQLRTTKEMSMGTNHLECYGVLALGYYLAMGMMSW